MFRTIGRKDFIRLTITAMTVTTSALVGCGDDDDDDDDNPGAAGSNPGGADGEAGHGGKSGGGTSTTGGSTSGASGGGMSSGASGSGTSGSGTSGEGGEDSGSTAGATAGGGGDAGGAAWDGGHAGESGVGGAGGSAGESPVNDGRCEPAAMTETPVTHNHLPSSFTFFANFVNGSTSTSPFRLEALGAGPIAHWHDLQLTPQEVQTLRRGGTVTGKVSTRSTSVIGGVDSSGHTHNYTIACA